jgi:hypothetical protein
MRQFILHKKANLQQLYRKHGKKVILYMALYLLVKWSIIIFLGSRILSFF